MTDLLVPPDEIERLTGYKRPSRQVDELRRRQPQSDVSAVPPDLRRGPPPADRLRDPQSRRQHGRHVPHHPRCVYGGWRDFSHQFTRRLR